jgi:methylglutaconyl-CoA hydratase
LAPVLGMRKIVQRIGIAGARALMLSGAEFDAGHAVRLGLVSYSVAPRDLDKVVENAIDEYLECAPETLASTKQLLAQFHGSNERQAERSLAARVIGGAEANEGIAAFSEDRLPYWDPRHARGK